MRKPLLLTAVTITVVVGAYVAWSSHYQAQSRKQLQNCQSLKTGMTAVEVFDILGQPRSVHPPAWGEHWEVWYYGISNDGSGSVSASIDTESRLLIGFECNEGEWVDVDFGSIRRFGVDSLLRIEDRIAALRAGDDVSSFWPLLTTATDSFNYLGRDGYAFPGLLTGDGRPIVYLDSTRLTVAEVRIGREHLLSEDVLRQFSP